MVNVLPPINEVPAAHLAGRDLGNGWFVDSLVTKHPGATGGHFSIPYMVVHRDGRRAFLKALNFHAALTGPGSPEEQLNKFTSAYIFERDLLSECGARKMSRVIRMIDHGHVLVPEAGVLSKVPYIILELADGDLNDFQARSQAFDCAWAFRVMKHVILGIGQLHAAHTAHQDLKPSNVLTQDNGMEMKLGDLGRAHKLGIDMDWSDSPIPGAITYAPPEQLYGAFGKTWEERKAADMYLAGSLGAQLFLGNCMSVLIHNALPAQLQYRRWQGTYEGVLPYLRRAHNRIITVLEHVVLQRTYEKESAQRFATAIHQMTHPSPAERGHPKDRAARTSSYSVQRYVSLMNMLAKRAELRLIGEPISVSTASRR